MKNKIEDKERISPRISNRDNLIENLEAIPKSNRRDSNVSSDYCSFKIMTNCKKY